MSINIVDKSIILNEFKSVGFYRDVVVEIVGTFLLMSAQCALPLSWGKEVNPPGLGNIVQVALGMGFVVCAIGWALGDFGGCHMNPAVSIAMVAKLRITVTRGLLYVVAQCLGGMAGAGFIYGITPPQHRETLAATTLHSDLSDFQGVMVEVWLTFVLVCTIHGATNERRKGNIYMPTIIIGFAVALGVLSGNAQTGASMNPARSLGPAVVMNIWDKHWIYWVGPIIGGLLATLVYQLFDISGRDKTTSNTQVAAMDGSDRKKSRSKSKISVIDVHTPVGDHNGIKMEGVYRSERDNLGYNE